MRIIKRPLNKSILLGCIVTFTILCILLSMGNYFAYRSMLYNQYDNHLRNVLTNTACDIDVDDLAECIRTGKESEKFRELQAGLDERKDNTDLHYLYIIIPLNTDAADNIQNVMAAMSKEEYEETPKDKVELNSLTGDTYSPAVAAKYLSAYESGELSYFESQTEFGSDYTCLMPLFDSKGNKVAALCVDVETREIRSLLLQNTLIVIGILLTVGFFASLLFILWSKKNIIRPIETLEHSVSNYTANELNSNDPDSLLLKMPEIHTGNEIESLAHKIVLMSEALYITVSGMLQTKDELEVMNIIALKDSLTQVGNKTAFQNYVDELQQNAKSGEAEFAVVMADINLLKTINDTYGHEKGDLYIQKCCNIICDVYKHSPVFRVGGDEFVIFLTGHDYELRDELLRQAAEKFDLAAGDDSEHPWNKSSMALGMAEYDPKTDTDIQQVLDRADRLMYENKVRMHKSRR